MTDPIVTFRDTLRKISPSWLQQGTALRVLYSIGVQIDAFGEALVAGLKARFPNYYSSETLPIIGRERRIRRGPSEADATYATRLTRWLDDHRLRGGPYALLAQVFAYYAVTPFEVELVYYSGRRYSMDTAGVVTRDDITWSPDLNTAKWARWWMFYHWPDPVVSDGIWSDPGTWSDGGVWDSELTVEEVEELRLVPTEWNAAHPFGTLVLMNDGVELWDYPPGVWSDPGDWLDTTDGPVQLGIN